MKPEHMKRALMVLIPWLILGGMVFSAYLPIFRGEKYLLQVKPRDPRDFFRGNYVDLEYDFSRGEAKTLPIKLEANKIYHFGDVLYLNLAKVDGILKPVSLVASADKAQGIRLKVQPRWSMTTNDAYFTLVSGLESFFAPKREAENWEKALREGRVLAEVFIDKAGNARLTNLVMQPEKPKPAEDERD